jgi:septum formation protein
MIQHKPIILASASQGRARMLADVGLVVTPIPSCVDEANVKAAMLAEGCDAQEIAAALADMKARQISTKHTDALVIGADQTLALGSRLFDKPDSIEEARAALVALSDQSHHLYSAAVCQRDGQVVWRHTGIARLTMRPLTTAFIDMYLEQLGDRVMSTVGGYEVEGVGLQLFTAIDGDTFTIRGLPLLPLLGYLRDAKVISV